MWFKYGNGFIHVDHICKMPPPMVCFSTGRSRRGGIWRFYRVCRGGGGLQRGSKHAPTRPPPITVSPLGARAVKKQALLLQRTGQCTVHTLRSGPLVGKNRDGTLLVRWSRQSKEQVLQPDARLPPWSPDLLPADGSRTKDEDVLQWLNGMVLSLKDRVAMHYTEPDAHALDPDDDTCITEVKCLRQILECDYVFFPVCVDQCYHPHAAISMVCAHA